MTLSPAAVRPDALSLRRCEGSGRRVRFACAGYGAEAKVRLADKRPAFPMSEMGAYRTWVTEDGDETERDVSLMTVSPKSLVLTPPGFPLPRHSSARRMS